MGQNRTLFAKFAGLVRFYARCIAMQSFASILHRASGKIGQNRAFLHRDAKFCIDFDVLNTILTKIELSKPMLKNRNRALKTLNPKIQNRIKNRRLTHKNRPLKTSKSTSKPSNCSSKLKFASNFLILS